MGKEKIEDYSIIYRRKQQEARKKYDLHKIKTAEEFNKMLQQMKEDDLCLYTKRGFHYTFDHDAGQHYLHYLIDGISERGKCRIDGIHRSLVVGRC